MRTRKIPQNSPYGNYVFANLSKLCLLCISLDCRDVCEWDGNSIVVGGSVVIKSPYTVTNVSGKDEKYVNDVKKWVRLTLLSHSLVVRYGLVWCFLKKQSELPESNQRPLDCCGAATTV